MYVYILSEIKFYYYYYYYYNKFIFQLAIKLQRAQFITSQELPALKTVEIKILAIIIYNVSSKTGMGILPHMCVFPHITLLPRYQNTCGY